MLDTMRRDSEIWMIYLSGLGIEIWTFAPETDPAGSKLVHICI
jgi:hypothetical protein